MLKNWIAISSKFRKSSLRIFLDPCVYSSTLSGCNGDATPDPTAMISQRFSFDLGARLSHKGWAQTLKHVYVLILYKFCKKIVTT